MPCRGGPKISGLASLKRRRAEIHRPKIIDTMRLSTTWILLLSSSCLVASTRALSPSINEVTGRRRALQNMIGGSSLAFVAAAPSAVRALDMDAFVNSQLDADTKNCDPKRDPKCKPELSKDEALCKYGQSGEARGEACRRVKAAGGELPKPGSGGKSLGGAYAM